MKQLRYILLSLCACLFLSSCSSTAEDLSARSDTLEESLQSFSKMSFSKLIQNEENLLYSPYSAYLALTLCASDTVAETQQEIFQALSFHGDLQAFIDQNETILEQLTKENYQIANSLWYDQSVTLGDDMTSTASKQLAIQLKQRDFKKDPLQEETKEWIKEATHQTLDPKFSLDPSSKMIFINTLYFQALWKYPFIKDHTNSQVFHIDAQTQVKTPFMHQTLVDQPYLETDSYEAISLPLRNGSKMCFYLPKQDHQIADILKDPQWLTQLQKEPEQRATIKLSLPTFSIQQEYSLDDTLQQLGIKRLYSQDAQVSSHTSDASLSVSKILQGNAMEVGETGIEASAFTADFLTTGISPVLNKLTMTFDHPFLFVLFSSGDLPMMMGYLQHP